MIKGDMSSKRWLAPWKGSADMIIMMKGQAYHHGQSTRFNIRPAPPLIADCRTPMADFWSEGNAPPPHPPPGIDRLPAAENIG